MSKFTKGLIIAIATVLITYFGKDTVCLSTTCLELVAISTVGTVLVYFAQSYAIPSTSFLMKYNLQDAFKTLVMAVGAGLSDFVAQQVVTAHIDFISILKLVGGIIVTHVITTLRSDFKIQ